MKRPRPKSSSPSPAAPVADAGALTGEEHALWRHVAATIAPVKLKGRIRRTGAVTGDDSDAEAVVPPRRAARTKPGSLPAASSPVVRPATVAAPTGPAPAMADFDPRKAKKIGNGRAGIDARLDLHGLRQDEALMRLRGFLREAHARGHKTVLVITGKGRETDASTTPYVDTLDRLPRGVLRRNLPRWLDEPDLRAIVVSYTTAAQRHGGDGAFYVELRRRAR